MVLLAPGLLTFKTFGPRDIYPPGKKEKNGTFVPRTFVPQDICPLLTDKKQGNGTFGPQEWTLNLKAIRARCECLISSLKIQAVKDLT